MTGPHGHLRAGFEAVTGEDLRLLREALLGPTEAERTFLSQLNQSRLAAFEFFTDSSEQFRYRIQWTERGRLRSHERIANIAVNGAGRRDLLLDDFPSSIEPLGLLEGDFDREFFSAHAESIVLPTVTPQVRRRPPIDVDLDRDDFPLRLGAASEDDDFDFADDGLLILRGDTPDEDDELPGPARGTCQKTNLWKITWPANGELTFEYRPNSPPDFDELPAIVSVDYLDDDGNAHQHETFVCLARPTGADSNVRRQSIDSRQLPYPGDGKSVNVYIRPVTKHDVIRIDGAQLAEPDRLLSASYLANCRFDAFTARRSENARDQVCFRAIDEHFPNSKKAYTGKIVPKTTEANGVDVAPFSDDDRTDRIQKMLLLVNDQFLKDLMPHLRLGALSLFDQQQLDYLEGVMLMLIQHQLENFERIYKRDGHSGLRRYFTKAFVREVKRARSALEIQPPQDTSPDQSVRDTSRHKPTVHFASTIADEDSPALDPADRADHTLMWDRVDFGELEPMLNEFLELQRLAGVDEIGLEAFTRKWRKKAKGQGEISDQAVADELNSEFGCSVTGDKVNDLRLGVWNRFRLYAVSKRIFRNCSGSTPLLNDADFERLHARLSGARRTSSLADLKIDVALASLYLRGEALITDEDLLFAEEWLLRGLERNDLAEMFDRTDAELEKWFGRLGVSLHAQILQDHQPFSKWTSCFLRHWLIMHEGVDKAAAKTSAEIDRNKARQDENRRRDEAKLAAGKLEKPTAGHTKDFDMSRYVGEIAARWEKSKTLIPEGHRQLPSMSN